LVSEVAGETDEKDEHARPEDERPRGQDEIGPLPIHARQIGVDSPRHTHQSGQMDGQEGDLHAGKHEPEHPFARPFLQGAFAARQPLSALLARRTDSASAEYLRMTHPAMKSGCGREE
jgi:hypothetical protein